MQRDQDRLDRQAVGRPEEELLEAVDLGGLRTLEDYTRQGVTDRLVEPPRDLEMSTPDRGIMDAPADDRREQTPDREVVGPERSGGSLEGVGRHVPGIEHGPFLYRRVETDVDASALLHKVLWRRSRPSSRDGIGGEDRRWPSVADRRGRRTAPAWMFLGSRRAVRIVGDGRNPTQPSEYLERNREVQLEQAAMRASVPVAGPAGPSRGPRRSGGEGMASRGESRWIGVPIIRHVSPSPSLPAPGAGGQSHIEGERTRMKRNPVAWAALIVAFGRIGQLIGLPAPDAGGARRSPLEGQQAARSLSAAYEAVAEFVRPSVVQITVQKKAGNVQVPGLPNMRRFQFPPHGNENMTPRDFEDMLRKFLNPEGNPEKEQFGSRSMGVGSGFVYDDHGHILTNNHVVENAEKIMVTFYDGVEVPAKVVGTDKQTDVAVIKVDSTSYQPLPRGDSTKLKVGELVMAVGSPFELSQSVTTGIVSALERNEPGDQRGPGLRVVHPDRRADQPGQLGRPAGEHERRGRRDQLGDRQRRQRQRRHRLRDPDEAGQRRRRDDHQGRQGSLCPDRHRPGAADAEHGPPARPGPDHQGRPGRRRRPRQPGG